MNFLLVEFNKNLTEYKLCGIIMQKRTEPVLVVNAVPASESQPIYFIQSTVII